MKAIPESIKSKIGINLHKKLDHPISIVKNIIIKHLKSAFKKISNSDSEEITVFDNLDCVVSVEDNFDLLLIPKTHPSRSENDTYYVSPDKVLRTHTSAHQNELLAKGYKSFLVVGDVYRKDTIDKFHYPVFHQIEGVYISEHDNVAGVEKDLKFVLGYVVENLFPGKEYRFAKDYFPFTDPSFEIEVRFDDKWVEILGSGVIQNEILTRNGIKKLGFAFGIGCERMAMILFGITDIRKFWTNDERFLGQFKEGIINKFVPYPILPSSFADISFWINECDLDKSGAVAVAVAVAVAADKEEIISSWVKYNDFSVMIREICSDDIEDTKCIDKFYDKKRNRYSETFRLTFSPNKDENNHANFKKLINGYMEQLYKKIPTLSVEPR